MNATIFTPALIYLLVSFRKEKDEWMFITCADGSMNNPEDGVETANAKWPQMQQVGATAFTM